MSGYWDELDERWVMAGSPDLLMCMEIQITHEKSTDYRYLGFGPSPLEKIATLPPDNAARRRWAPIAAKALQLWESGDNQGALGMLIATGGYGDRPPALNARILARPER